MNAPTLKSVARLTRLDFLDGMGVAGGGDTFSCRISCASSRGIRPWYHT